MERAWVSVERGDYEAALNHNRELLMSRPDTAGDEALFMMAMLHADPLNPGADLSRSVENLDRLMALYPESSRAAEAAIWMRIITDLQASRKTMSRSQGEVIELRRLIKKNSANRDVLRNRIKEKRSEIEHMKLRVRSLEEDLANLHEQMERLKEVDQGIERKRREEIPRE